MPERGIHKNDPNAGTGKDKPEDRSLPNAGRRVKVVFRDADGKKLPNSEKDAYGN